jgi:hypothetical protein
MNDRASKYLIIAVLSFSVLNLAGCTATTKVIKHGKLEVETKMSDTVFLDPLEDSKKVYASCKAGIDFRNYTSLRFQGSRSAIFFAL